MDYRSQQGLSCFSGRKMMIFLYTFLLWCSIASRSSAILTEGEISPGKKTTIEPSKSEVSKREDPIAQRREHSFNADGTVNYHGSGSGHDSGDLVPPPGGSIFNSPSIELNGGDIGSAGPGLSNSYGVPIPSDSYGPPKNILDSKKPSFVFGSSIKSTFGPPSQQYGPPNNKYLPPPKPVYGPPSNHRPLPPIPPPKPIYGPPKPQFRPSSLPPKPIHGPSVPSFYGPPKPNYGPPPKPTRSKPSFSSRPKPVYGPPKQSFGTSGFSQGTLLSPVGGIKSQYGPPKISATYGTPLQPSTSYGVPKQIKLGHIKAPPTPPDVKYDGWKPIPGLISNAPSGTYGAPDTTGHGVSGAGFSSIGSLSGGGLDSFSPPSSSYGAPSFSSSSFGSSGLGIQLKPIKSTSFPLKPSSSYGTPLQPSTSYGPPFKSTTKGNIFSSLKAPSSSYGLPLPSLSPSPPKPGNSYGPPKPPSPSYGIPQISSSYGPPKAPSVSYGPPKPPSASYGPPKPPSPAYGPPSSIGSLRPPTGLGNSFRPPKPPGGAYGPPKPPSTSYGAPQIFTTYSIPKPGLSGSITPTTSYRGPPVPHPLQPPSTYGAPTFSGGLYKAPLPPNALYGVPTAPAPPAGVGCCGPSTTGLGFQGHSNTYGVPTFDLHPPVVQIPSIEIGSQLNQFVSTGPSPVFSHVGPSQSYGTPLLQSTPASLHSPSGSYGVPTALPLRQPKNPVKFRPPVPAGLISSIGAKWGDSAAWGGDTHSHKFQGDTYIPPAVPDPDPGIRSNHGNALVIPPPSAPPINYGPPPSNSHHDTHQQISTQLTSSAEGDLNPPPPVHHEQGSFDIQQSASIELPNPNALDLHGGGDSQNHISNGVTSYNAPTESHHIQSSSVVTGSQNYNVGVQNIPIKGNQGSYTLQIQAAGGNSGQQIPHGEVLSNGLLQDILAAIENPSASGKLQQYGNDHSSDPVASEIGLNILKQIGGTQAQKSNSIQLPTQYGSDLSHSSSNNVPIYTQTSEINNEVIHIPSKSFNSKSEFNSTTGVTEGKIAHYLNQNNVALYYNNQEEGLEERKGDEKDIIQVQMLLPRNSTNPHNQDHNFGSLVSINPQNAQIGVNSTNSTKQILSDPSSNVS